MAWSNQNLIINTINLQDMASQQSLDISNSTLRSIFPSLHLPTLTPNSPFLSSLDEIAKLLPVPHESDLPTTITSMCALMDEQQYKYQRSLLECQPNQMILFDQECHYNQNSSTFMSKKATNYTQNQPSSKNVYVEDIWNWKAQKEYEQQIEDYYCFD